MNKRGKNIGRRILLLLLTGSILAGSCDTLRAQYTIRVNTVAIPPMSAYLDQMLGSVTGGHFMVMVSNTNPLAGPVSIKIAGTLQCLSPNPFTITLNQDFHPQQPIFVGSAPVTLSPYQLEQAFGNLIPNNLATQSISVSSLQKGINYQLPEGTYRICFTAYLTDLAGYTKPISDPNAGCAIFTVCYKASAPQFIQPVNNLSLSGGIPVINPSSPVQFTWTAPNSTCGSIIQPLSYDFEMHEIFNGQTATDALNNPPVFLKQGLPSVIFPLDTVLYKNILQIGKQYAIRVHANANVTAFAAVSSGVVFANNGFSTVGAFQYGNAGINPILSVSNIPVELPGGSRGNNPPVNTGTPANCGLAPPGNTSPIQPGSALAGVALNIGGFTLTPDNTIVQNSDGSWTGGGTIDWKPFASTIKLAVAFANIKVNTDKQVVDGTVTASLDPATFPGQSFAQWSNFTGQSGTQLDQLAGSVGSYLQSNPAAHLASQISGNSPVPLPLGLDNQSIGGQPATLAILGMAFSPRGATMNVLYSMNIPEANGWLTLAGVNICLSPSGVNFGQATLLLPADRNFNIGAGGNDLMITFKGCSNADSVQGTYASWAGGQLSDIVAHAQMSFPQHAIVPEDNNGNISAGSVVAALLFKFSAWDDWVASATVPDFEINGITGLGFRPGAVFYDHSLNRNAPGFSFPNHYANPDGNSFEGLYIQNMQVLLPAGFRTFNQGSQRTAFNAQNFVLDDEGVSADITASNIISLSTGDLGGWSFSVAQVEVLVIQNTFQSGSFSGQVLLPVSSTPLNYSADLHLGNDALQYSFVINPSGNLSFDIWKASVTLDGNSSLQVSQDAQGTAISAALNGSIGITISNGSPSVSFPGMSFTGLGIGNRNSQTNGQGFGFNAGNWSFASPQKTVAGFPVSVNNISPLVDLSNPAKIKLGLQFDLNINIGVGDASVVSSTTKLDVYGTINAASLIQAPKIILGGGVDVDSVAIHGDVGPLSVDGSLVFYNHDNTYGDGLKGHVVANFPMVTAEATAQFGNINNFNYWYIDACANFPVIPIPPTPIGISGFGGGAYYNMAMQNNLPSDPANLHAASQADDATPGRTMSGVSFVPQQGTAGIRASICIATAASEDAMNAKVTLTGQISNGAFEMLDMQGNMYILTNYPSNTSAVVQGAVDISYDFVHDIFSLNADIKGNIGTTFDVPIGIYAGPSGWYFKMGDPFAQRISVQLVNINNATTQFQVTATAYFEMGTLINPELPPLPQELVAQGIQRDPSVQALLDQIRQQPSGFSLAIMFGARLDATFKFNFACIYANVTGVLGFDLGFFDFSQGALCNANAGWNGWYATGQFYAYLGLDVGISVDVWFFSGNLSLATFSVACNFDAGLPNPTWLDGSVYISGSVLDGAVSFGANAHISVGDKCYGTPPDPLTNIQIISDYGPTGKAGVFDYPYVASNLGLEKNFSVLLPPTQSKPQGETRIFQFDIQSFSITGGGRTVQAYKDYENGNTTVVFKHNDMLQPNTNYTVTAVCNVMQFDADNDEWELPYNDKDGKNEPMTQTTTFNFTTGAAPNNIPDQNVHFTYPVNRQRYLLQKEFAKGSVQFDQWQDNLFPPARSGTTFNNFVLYYIDEGGGDTVISTFVPNKGSNTLDFYLPGFLKNAATYRLEFWVQQGQERVLNLNGGGNGSGGPAVSQVSMSTRFIGTAGNGMLVNFRTTKISGTYQGTGPVPKPIYLLYFRTSRFNTLSDKINALGNWSGSRSGRTVSIQNYGGFLGEPFDQIETLGYHSPDGTAYPSLFQAGIDWNYHANNDNFADNDLYGSIFSLAPYRMTVDLGAPDVRQGSGALAWEPVHSLDWSGFYADPPLSASDMQPPGQSVGGSLMAQQLSSVSRTSYATGNAQAGGGGGGSGAGAGSSGSNGAKTGVYSAVTNSGLTMLLPSATKISSSGTKTISGSLHLKSGGGLPGLSYTLRWNRDYYIYEDWELFEVAGLSGEIEAAIIRHANPNPSDQQNALAQIGGDFNMAGNDIGGSISIPYNRFYSMYSSQNGYSLLDKFRYLPFSAYPGGSRPVKFWYSAGTQQGNAIIKTFTLK